MDVPAGKADSNTSLDYGFNHHPGANLVDTLDTLGYLHLYLVPFIVFTGLTANIGCGFILTFSKLRKIPLTVFVSGCIFSDSVFLLGLFCTWLATGPAAVNQNIEWCYFVSMITNYSYFLSSWCRVAVLVHCYILAGTTKLISGLLAKSIITGIAILSIVVYVNLTLIIDSQEMEEVPICRPLASYIRITQVLNTVDFFFNTLLPYLLVMVFIIITLLALKRRNGHDTELPKMAGKDSDIIETELGKDVNVTETELTVQRPLSCADSLQLAQAVCFIFITVLLLGLPSLMLRLIHTMRKMYISEDYIPDTEILAQSATQYLMYTTYVIKSILLPFLWKPYCRVTIKILKRSFRVPLSMFRCKKQSQLTALTVVLQQNGQVTMLHPLDNSGTAVTSLWYTSSDICSIILWKIKKARRFTRVVYSQVYSKSKVVIWYSCKKPQGAIVDCVWPL